MPWVTVNENNVEKLLISDFAATLWFNSSKVKSFPIYRSNDPICLTPGSLMQKDMESVDVFISVNKCLIVSHDLFITESHIAIQVWVSSSFVINDSVSADDMYGLIIQEQYCIF